MKDDWFAPLVFIGLAGAILWWISRRRATSATVPPPVAGHDPTQEEIIGASVAGAACAKLGLGATVSADCAKGAAAVVGEAGALAPSTLGVSSRVGQIGALVATPVTLSTEATVKGSQIVAGQIEQAQTHWYGQVGTVLGAGVVLPTEGLTAAVGYISPTAGHYLSEGISYVGKKAEFWNW